MIGIVDLQRAEADLVAGELSCPGCGGMLRPWGYARSRRVRDHGSATLSVRPRRGRCVACGATQVLLLGSVLPRRADATAVVGTALLASAGGAGYRRIAAEIERPLSTVRRWLRSVQGSHTQWLHAQGVEWIHRLDPEVVATIIPARTGLGDALSALAAAAGAIRARLTPHVPVWTLIGQLTQGRLVPARAG
jgi:hypothetical protein